MLAHGYEPVGVPRTTPMAAGDSTAALLGAGYAVAQSAYSSQGWAVAEAITDMEHLRQHALVNSSACDTPGCWASRWVVP